MNLLSPSHQSPPLPTADSGLHSSPALTHCGSTGGFSVTVLPVITAFFSSLSPRYVPEGGSRPLRASTVANEGITPDNKDRQRGTDSVLDKVKLACTIASCWVPTARVVCEVVANVCSSFTLAQSLGSVLERKDEKQSDEQRAEKKQSTVPRPGSAAALVTLVALDNLAPAAAVPAHGERGSPQQPIEVPDSDTLGKIGQADYPTDAYYLQTQSFSHNHTEPGPVFQGHYQGGCHTISDLNTCLFRKLDRYGVVRDLHLTNATIDEDTIRLGAVVCEMAPFSSVRNMHLEHIKVTNRAESTQWETATAGIVVGHQRRAATISGMTIHNCSVNATGYDATGGIIGGLISGQARDINITDSQVVTLAERSQGGVGAGLLHGELDGLTVLRSQAHTEGNLADAGIGAGDINGGRLRHFAASDCQVSTHGRQANAGVGAGTVVGDLDQLTIVNCNSSTERSNAYAGIGAGQLGVMTPGRQGRMKNMTSVNNRVITKGLMGYAGIGAGQQFGETDNIVVIRSSVRTEGRFSPAAIGAGLHFGQLHRMTVVNSTVDTTGGSDAALEVAQVDNERTVINGTRSLGTRVNGVLVPAGSQALEPFCHGADPRFVIPDCQVILPDTVGGNCSSLPLNPAHGSAWQVIEVNDTSTFNKIGLTDDLPASAHYIQTTDLNGTELNGNESLVFNGHYDGRNHSIEGLQNCLFHHLQGTVKNLHLTDARISGNGQPVAVIACTMSDAGAIEHVYLSNCRVTSQGSAPAGLISGERVDIFSRVANAVVHNSTLETSGPDAPAGMVAGKCGAKTDGIEIHNSRVVTRGDRSHAGLGCGTLNNLLHQMVTSCSEVETHGENALGGIGAGISEYGGLGFLTSINDSVSTGGIRAPAGIGAGSALSGWLLKLNAIHGRVATRGKGSSAGVGVGFLDTLGSTSNMAVVHCQVITEGNEAHAGVCTGVKNTLAVESYCTSVNSSAIARGENSRVGLSGTGPGITFYKQALNTRLNGQLYDTGNIGNQSALCSAADSRFIQPDCRTTLAPSCPMSQSFYLPPAAVPLAAGLSTTAIAGIIAGGALVMLGAGYCYYRQRHSSRERAK